jgi:hypothetical protein
MRRIAGCRGFVFNLALAVQMRRRDGAGLEVLPQQPLFWVGRGMSPYQFGHGLFVSILT